MMIFRKKSPIRTTLAAMSVERETMLLQRSPGYKVISWTITGAFSPKPEGLIKGTNRPKQD
jgi:hypothetical protein